MTYPCPCCGHLVFREPPGSYEICSICFWEDDAVQLRWPDYAGGANGVSLVEAQQNFIRFGAADEQSVPHVRPPTDQEPREEGWRPLDPARDQFEPRGIQQAAWPSHDADLYYWRPTFWGPERRQRAARGERAERLAVLIGPAASLGGFEHETPRVRVRTFDGACLLSLDAVFDAFSVAFAFSDHSRRNLDGLRDSLTDVERIDDRDVRVLISDSHRLLEDEPRYREGLFRLLAEVGDYWADPPQADVSIPPRAFSVLLQVTPEHQQALAADLGDAGLPYSEIYSGRPSSEGREAARRGSSPTDA